MTLMSHQSCVTWLMHMNTGVEVWHTTLCGRMDDVATSCVVCHVWHVSCDAYVMWLVCHVWHDSFLRVTRLKCRVWHDYVWCVTWLCVVCDMACVTWLICRHVSHVWLAQGSVCKGVVHDVTTGCVTCDMTHSYMWHDSSLWVTWPMCHAWHDSVSSVGCVTWKRGNGVVHVSCVT